MTKIVYSRDKAKQAIFIRHLPKRKKNGDLYYPKEVWFRILEDRRRAKIRKLAKKRRWLNKKLVGRLR